MTRRGRLVLVAAIALYLAGAANASEAAYTFASALIGVLLATYVLSRLAASGLALTQAQLPDHVVARPRVSLMVEVANNALISKPRARLAFLLYSLMFPAAPKRICARVPPLRRRGRVQMEVTFFVPWRGPWLIEDVHLEGSDPLGLYMRREQKKYSGLFLAAPPYWAKLPVPWQNLLAPSTRLQIAAQRAETGEYRTVRDYVPGDDIRHIHWRASAHRNKLQVKVYEQRREVEAQVWLLPVGYPGSINPNAETAISVAATLAHAFIMAGLSTVLRAPFLPPEAQGPDSTEQFWVRVLAALAELRYCREDELHKALEQWPRSAHAGGTLYIISNSAQALRALLGVAPRFSYPIPVLTGSAEADSQFLLVRDNDEIPVALASLARERLAVGAVAYGC